MHVSFFLDQRRSHLVVSLIYVSYLNFLRSEVLICTDRMPGFMGPGKPSSLVTTLLNRTFLLQGSCMKGEQDSPG
jgi:hypothetical protein